ncbi:MAG: hypothetical protein MJ097_08500 [Dorea sp.]|nr:hypothetical protein [Dorea sp.]
MAVIILIKWELTVWLYPERFSEKTNEYLKCEICTEKLCVHKKQLKSFRKSLVTYTDKQIRRILKGTNLENTYNKLGENQQIKAQKSKISKDTQIVTTEKEDN